MLAMKIFWTFTSTSNIRREKNDWVFIHKGSNVLHNQTISSWNFPPIYPVRTLLVQIFLCVPSSPPYCYPITIFVVQRANIKDCVQAIKGTRLLLASSQVKSSHLCSMFCVSWGWKSHWKKIAQNGFRIICVLFFLFSFLELYWERREGGGREG